MMMLYKRIRNISDTRYKFTVGKAYKGEYTSDTKILVSFTDDNGNRCSYFTSKKHAGKVNGLSTYFVSIHEYRDEQIDKLLEDVV